jgi:hypothetical protein
MTSPKRGDIVSYANGQYLVADVQADLLVLEGVAVIHGSSGSCRARCTVLASDVTVVGVQHELEGV